MRVAIYTRVSTDEQTTDNQKRELIAAVTARDWSIVAMYEDAGISGVKGRDKRPGLDNLLKDAVRRRFDVVAAWSVDRLGRSLKNLVEILGELQAAGVDLYLHQQAMDTTTPSGKAMFQMCGVFAEFERSIIQARVLAGLERARAAGKQLGPPRKYGPEIVADVTFRLEMGEEVASIARDTGMNTRGVYRIKKEKGL